MEIQFSKAYLLFLLEFILSALIRVHWITIFLYIVKSFFSRTPLLDDRICAETHSRREKDGARKAYTYADPLRTARFSCSCCPRRASGTEAGVDVLIPFPGV